MVTRCCSPPESSVGRCSVRWPSPTRSSVSVARRRASRVVHAGEQQRHLDVLDRAEHRDEVERLEDEAHRRRAVARALGVAQLVQRPRRRAATRPPSMSSRPEQAVQQRRLARTRRSHDRDELTGTHAQVHVAQRPHLPGAGAVDLAHPFGVEQRRGGDRRRPRRRVGRSHGLPAHGPTFTDSGPAAQGRKSRFARPTRPAGTFGPGRRGGTGRH